MASSERADQILAQMADNNPELIEGLIGAQIQNIESSGAGPQDARSRPRRLAHLGGRAAGVVRLAGLAGARVLR